MGALRLPADAVILTGDALPLVAYAVDTTQRARARNGLPPLASLDALRALVAPVGHADTADDADGYPELVTTREAAELLHRSVRTVRRLAPGLGGRLVGGRLLLDRQAIIEHQQGATAQTGT